LDLLARFAVALALAVAVASCAPSGAALDRQHDRAREELRRGMLDEALGLAQRGEADAERAEDVVRAWRFRLLAADALALKLDIPAALELLERPVPEAPAFAHIRARQQFLLARTRVSQGQLAAAGPLVDAALPLAEGDADLVLDLELLESQLLYRSGRAAEADALLASARQRTAGEGDHYRQAQVSNTLGMGLVTRGRFDEALPYFDRILALGDLNDTTIHGAALNNAGLCHARLGQFDRAVALQLQAVRVQQQGRKRDYAQALGELGNTYLLQDDIEQGTEYLRQAFTIAAAAGLQSDAALWARNLAAAFVALGRWDEASRFNREASRLAAPGSASPYGVVTEAQVAAGRGQVAEAGRLFEQALAASEATPGVQWMSHDGLARLAAAGNRPAEATRHFEAALDTVEQTRSALLRADFRISFTSRLIAFYRGYTDFLLARGDTARALEVADSSRARVLAERQGVSSSARRASAPALVRLARQANATLVLYALGPERSWVWTVTGTGVRATALPPAVDIEALVAEHQSAVQNTLADPLAAQAGSRLYDMLVRPMAAAVPRGANLVIVPDGALHRVNFETLPAPGEPRHYWIEDVTIQIAPSLSMLRPAESARSTGVGVRSAGVGVRSAGVGVRSAGASAPATSSRPASAPATPASLLLIGNPTPRPPEFPALGYAPAEMERVARHFPPAEVTTVEGALASPAAFRAAGPERFSVIHFTSHAVANIENPLDSAVILSGPDQAFKLYARDVAQMPLTTDLVTVSACRSAGDRAFAGEGLVGFAWAFLRAGSRRVVAGLWDVDDRSTAILMDDFYARIAAGASPATALREAKLALIKQGFPKPFYWAPFQVFTVVL